MLRVGQLAEFTNQGVLIDAGEPLNGMFRQPARLSDVHFSAQPAQLRSERHNHNQRRRIVGLRIGQGQDGKRCLAARPKSTIQTSPARASIFAKGFFPHLALLGCAQQSLGMGGDGKRQIVSKLNLCEKDLERVIRLHSQAGKDLFRLAQTRDRNSDTKKRDR